MSVSYDVFHDAFFNKIMEYEFIKLSAPTVESIVNGYMKSSCASFTNVCKYKLTKFDDTLRIIDVTIPDDEIQEIADIVATGMVVQWLQPYIFHQDNIQNILSPKDYSVYSPAELTYRVKELYQMARRDFKNMQYDYSYDHGDLSDLHT